MRRTVLFTCTLLLFAGSALAQSVPIKTIPVAEGDQFMLFPSEKGGMGSVGIALDDRLADPFVNPARAAALGGVQFFSTPVYYGFGPLNGNDEGSGRTLPLGLMAHRDAAFGGVMMAYQELVPARNPVCCFGGFVDRAVTRNESTISANNLYLLGLAGLEIPGSEWSVAVSAFHGELGGLEGVRRLYAANTIRQDGSMQQYRAGAFREWDGGHAAELVLMLHRFQMTHRIDQSTWNETNIREEHDETRSFAAQAEYRYAFETGWTLGGRVVGDWKWHPKIPNYDLMQIPRDPGNSAAYNLGVGLSTTSGSATFAVDFVFEPIWSHTWANAVEPTPTANGGVVHPGSMTVENHFDFANARIAMGVHFDGDRVDFATGIDMHHISYDLDQMDYVENRRRLLGQQWTEWTWSAGFGTEFSGFLLQYTGRLTLGTGTPAVQGNWGARAFADVSADWVVAPRGPLVLDETAVLSHQLSLIVPLVPGG